MSRNECRDAIGVFRTNLEDKFSFGQDFFPAVYAGFSWWALARDLLADEDRLPTFGDEMVVPPDEWSACFLASLAYAGGARWEAAGDAERRREFWRWFLEDNLLEQVDSAL